LAIIVLVGAGLRLAALSRSAVEHFDEGVYASNLYFGAPDFAYPQQRFYAPPLLPALIEAGMLAGLRPNVAALLPGFLAGCGTIVALWWFGRSWFSPAVGLAAATLAALSDFHIAYSAAALTDVLFGLWLVLAVDAITRSLFHLDYRWAIGAGIYTGLAWWTKYNGWLPLAIEAAALPLLWLVTPQSILRKLGCFATTTTIAIAVWSPYYLSLQASGGYGPISANHAKYVVGLAGWFDTAGRQIAAQREMEGPLSAAALGIAAVVTTWVSAGSRGKQTVFSLGAGLVVAGGMALGLGLSSFVVLGLIGAVGLAWSLIVIFRSQRQDEARDRSVVATCLIAVWWAGLFAATFCYWPYPRLVLPWLMASWLGTALCFQRAADLAERRQVRQNVPHWAGLVVVAIALAGIGWFSSQRTKSPAAVAESDRASYQKIAAQIREQLNLTDFRVIYTCGEPALLFQLRAAGEPLVAPSRDIPDEAVTVDGKPMPTFLVLGPHARGDRLCQEQWTATKDKWQLVQSYNYTPRAIVRLDLYDPRQPLATDERQLNRIEVYRLK